MSQSIDLDFIQPSALSLKRFALLKLVALFIGLVTTVVTWKVYQSKQIQLTMLETEMAELNQVKKIQPNVKQTVILTDPEKTKELQEVVNILSLPWSGLFEAIEHASNIKVTLLSFEPNAKKQLISITGEAKNLQTVLQYLDLLKKQSGLTQVFLQKHNLEESNISKPVRFTVQAKWEVTS